MFSGGLHIGSPEAFGYNDSDIDPKEYTRFLNEVRLIARVRPGQDDINLRMAELLVERCGLTDDDALQKVLVAAEE